MFHLGRKVERNTQGRQNAGKLTRVQNGRRSPAPMKMDHVWPRSQALADGLDFAEQSSTEILDHVVADCHFCMATAVMAELPAIRHMDVKGDAFFRPDLAQPAMRRFHTDRYEIRSRWKGRISGDSQCRIASYRFFMHSASTLSVGRSGEARPEIRAPEPGRHSAGQDGMMRHGSPHA